jgi:hypothetical protein
VLRADEEAMRWLAVVLALPALVGTGWAMLVGLLFGLGLKCDDSCDAQSTAWRDNPDAWQWNALAVAGVAIFAIGIAFVVLVWLGRTWWAAAAYAAGLVASLWFMTGFTSDWIDHLDRRSFGELAFLVMVLGLPVAALLAARRPQPGRATP